MFADLNGPSTHGIHSTESYAEFLVQLALLTPIKSELYENLT